MKKLLVAIMALMSLSLFAEEEEEFSLVNLTKSPISRIAGSVNIISGDWIDQAVHHETSGPDPYVLAHSYISSNVAQGSLVEGWDLLHPSTLKVFQPQGIVYVAKGAVQPNLHPPKKQSWYRSSNYPLPAKPNNPATLYYREAGGATVVLDGDNAATHFTPRLSKTGYTLINSIEKPVRRDARRITISRHSASDRWIVHLSDGTKRTYTRVDKGKDRKDDYTHTYHIKFEELPSGNWRHYAYDNNNRLEFIRTVSSDNKHVLNSLAITWKKDRVHVVSSDGITTTFHLKHIHNAVLEGTI